ncbi:4-aminobutyrate aminotransferase [Arthrobacter sp. Leaf141]|uniref:aminotransferase n=1 Tax=Arthrobacter sp. Leaf141 TaxID=1736273 RepID=UPI0006F7B650|nr:aminotransferase [Arthrobacter sp. Leaf141]KQR00440.1 4-aminobutyrate aminotransferase [Arthrobacter sp. Leaf141]
MSSKVFDYFEQVELPTPTLETTEVLELVASTFGLQVSVQALGSQQDQNFRLFNHGSPHPLGVLKLSNPVFSAAEIHMQDQAAIILSKSQSTLRIPRIVTGPRGPMSAWWETSQGRIHARVIENIAGLTLTGSGYLAPDVVARMGEIAARTSLALADFEHVGTSRVLQWDLRHARRVIERLLPLEPDRAIRDFVEESTLRASRVLEAVEDLLPVQAGHFDITDDNVLRPDGGRLPDAVIDFGDVCASWRVGELAITVSSLLHHDAATPATTLPAIRAFHSLRPLGENEVTALWALVVLRGAVLVLSGRHQVRLDEANSYADAALEREFRVLSVAASVPPEVMTGAIRQALRMPPRARRPWNHTSVLAPLGVVTTLDGGTASALNDDGAWMKERTLDEAAAEALNAGADAAVLPAWRPVLTAAPIRTPSAPETIPTGLTLWLSAPRPLAKEAHVSRVNFDSIAVSIADEVITISAPGLGDQANHALPARTRLFVQRDRRGVSDAPTLVTADLAAGWAAVLDDPAPALGLACTETSLHDDVLARRDAVLAEVQEHYYAVPPQIERGWREYLIGIDGRVYLDMVNNVASVGHAHPRVTEAATRQMRLLNTNSRFHYRAIADYAERIVATLPDELDTVFFVNSGSEATDLAIRLAMASTGRRDIVAMRESYHGWTFASDAVSTSIADNPAALGSRPEWVHTVAAANSYRGELRGPDAAGYASKAVQMIDNLAAAGTVPAGFICESYFGNAGGVALPDGYLKEVYAAIRKHGGIAIADEVQVGFGRLGDWFWGFQQQGAVPDVVAVAKSIGAGQPIGAVVTRREIANRYRTQGYFFSSTGGSPVSSVIGMAVLDIIQDEGLQENARIVGTHLKNRLEVLGKAYGLVGAIHGSGLYLGLEFVKNRVTLEPATEETAAICNRLLELGVFMQPTGDYLNVLKIKPPLCVSKESADYFVDSLAHVLETGW